MASARSQWTRSPVRSTEVEVGGVCGSDDIVEFCSPLTLRPHSESRRSRSDASVRQVIRICDGGYGTDKKTGGDGPCHGDGRQWCPGGAQMCDIRRSDANPGGG